MLIGDLDVVVVRKRMRHLRLTISPPDGTVRVAGPLQMSDHAVREMVTARRAWIKRHQARFETLPRHTPPAYVTGENHWFQGQIYRLAVMCHDGPGRVSCGSDHTLHLLVPEGSDTALCERVLLAWYRQHLTQVVPPLIARWEDVLGVKVAAWGVKQMRTRWGSCTVKERRISLSLALAQKSPQCLEYIVAHELMHLLVQNHGARFKALMDKHVPAWRQYRTELNAPPPAR